MNLRDTQASFALDLMRVLAAQAVCVGHAIVNFGVASWALPPHMPYMQNIGVLLFFVLSGFLIAYTLNARSADARYGFGSYLIDRFARIYSGLVPCLLAVAVIDFAFGKVGSTYTLHAFVTSLLMLENIPGPLSTFNGVAFGTATQLWTLAIEWHLYLFAGALFFIRRSRWMLPVVALCCIVPAGYLMTRPKFIEVPLGLTFLWFFGFAAYYALPFAARLPRWLLAAASIAFVAIYGWYINPGAEYHRSSYGILVLAFVCIVALASRIRATEGMFSRAVRFAADYSFTLYLVHYSLVLGLVAVWSGDKAVGALVAFIVSNLLSVAIAMPTEMRHKELARWLRRLFGATIRRPVTYTSS